MKLTLLGTGTNYVSADRYAACIMVEHDGVRWLLDMGSHASRRLAERKLTLLDVDRVFISHRHFDHMGDLVPSLLGMTLGVLVYGKERRQPMRLHGYPGFAKDYAALSDMAYPDHPEPYEIVVNEHGNGQLEADGLVVQTALVPHMERYMKAIAMRVTAPDGWSVAYSGDTGACDELVTLARGADTLIAESAFTAAQYQQHGPRYGHMAPQDAGKMAAEAGVRRLVLTHLYDGLEDPEVMFAAVRGEFDGEVVLAHDGLELTNEQKR